MSGGSSEATTASARASWRLAYDAEQGSGLPKALHMMAQDGRTYMNT